MQCMQIRKIKVKFVMLIIEEAFAWPRWTINNCRIIRSHEYFNPLSMFLIEYQSSNLKRLKIYAYNCVPQILQVMINWKLVNSVDLNIWLKWTISACIDILFSFDWWIFKTNSNSKHLNTSVKRSSLETKY